MERVEKREKEGKTEKKKDKENVDPEKKKGIKKNHIF